MLVFLFYTELPSLLSVFIAFETNPDTPLRLELLPRRNPLVSFRNRLTRGQRMRIKTRGVEVEVRGSGSSMEVEAR